MLERHGHEVKLLVVTRRTPVEVVADAIAGFSRGFIGFSTTAPDYNLIEAIGGWVRKRCPDAYLAVGGPYARTAPEDLVDGPWDCICIGEGEQCVPTLVEALDRGKRPDDIQGLWLRTPQGFRKNVPLAFNEKLDELPFMIREPWNKWTGLPGLSHTLLVSRGCPFSCAYCSNHQIRRRGIGRYMNFRSVGSIVEEMESLVARYPETVDIGLECETLTANRTWFDDLCVGLTSFNARRKAPVVFRTSVSPMPRLDWDGFFRSCSAAGISAVSVGVESGSELVRRTILRRNYSNDDIREMAAACRRHGIFLTYQLMIGIPGETKAAFREGVALCVETKPDDVHLYVTEYYPGTDLFEKVKELGILGDTDPRTFSRAQPSIDLPGFSRAEIEEERRTFKARVFAGRGGQSYNPLLEFYRRAGVKVSTLAPRLRAAFFATYRPRGEVVW